MSFLGTLLLTVVFNGTYTVLTLKVIRNRGEKGIEEAERKLTRLLKILGSNSSFSTQTNFRLVKTKGKAQLGYILSPAGVTEVLSQLLRP
jgi:hypothetical protein